MVSCYCLVSFDLPSKLYNMQDAHSFSSASGFLVQFEAFRGHCPRWLVCCLDIIIILLIRLRLLRRHYHTSSPNQPYPITPHSSPSFSQFDGLGWLGRGKSVMGKSVMMESGWMGRVWCRGDNMDDDDETQSRKRRHPSRLRPVSYCHPLLTLLA